MVVAVCKADRLLAMLRLGSFLQYCPLRGRRALAAALMLAVAGPVLAQEVVTAPPVVEARGAAILITPDNTQPLLPGDRRLARVTFPDTDAAVLGTTLNGAAHQMLRRLFVAGKAAGNSGDLYENRDRGHSRLLPEAHPQLTHVIYADSALAQSWDYGLAGPLIYDAPLIGNSSTALTAGVFWRSQPRLALTAGDGLWPHRLYQNYVAGQIHVYPEHRDHDPEQGDLLPANTPYYLISQGSSGSDRAHLEALVMILAAFRPDTKAVLRETGLIASTVQMVYRRARVGVRNRAAYLSGAAHPSVFRAHDIALARMVGLANAIKPDEIPPMVRLKVLEESNGEEGVDFFGEGISEVLFDTPSAIARVWRSRTGRRSMVVTAADTRDPNGRALRFDWVMLRGDPGRVRITPLTPDGRYAHIEMDWQDPLPTLGAPDILSHRIDIGVFANNGIHDSAPAFISVLLPRHEARVYAPGPDGAPRIISIDRGRVDGIYADPQLFPEIPWRDHYHYDAAGRFTGWTRHRAGEVTEYDVAGRRILVRDAQGLPVKTAPVRYLPKRDENGPILLQEELVSLGPGQ
jgi:hypothetical protein